MKKLSFITGLLTGLMIIFAALGCVGSVVGQTAADEHFYSDMSRAAVAEHLGAEGDPLAGEKITEYIGMDETAQKAFASDIAAFMAGKMNALPADVLNEDEQQHMFDVRRLTQVAAGMGKTYLTLAAVLAVVIAWLGAILKRSVKPKLIGGITAAGAIALLVMSVVSRISGGGFEGLFVRLHEMLFTNDLWLMNPQTDILIRMMPQPLFEQALLNGANQALRMLLIVCVMLIAIDFVIGGMIRRLVVKKEG